MSSRGDALDLFIDETRQVREIRQEWEATFASDEQADDLAGIARRHGTVGKLMVEHEGVRLAARDDVIRVLRHHHGDGEMDDLAPARADLARALRAMDKAARGTQEESVGKRPDFAAAADRYGELLSNEPDDLDGWYEQLAGALGDHRGELRSSHHLRRHAPTHPAVELRWYQRISGITRIHAIYDRLRAFPSPGEEPYGDAGEYQRFKPS